MEVDMFGKELQLKNDADEEVEYIVRRLEKDPSEIEEVRVGSRIIEWASYTGGISFRFRLSAGESTVIKIIYRDPSQTSQVESQKFWDAARVALRRYLCEARDNYIAKIQLLVRGALGRKEQTWN